MSASPLVKPGLWRILLVCCLAALFQQQGQAQEFRRERQEFQQWINLSVRYSPRKSPWVFNAEYVMRNYGLLEQFKGSYYYMQTRYRFNKHWHADLHLRMVNSHIQDRYRWETGVRYRHKIGRGMVQVRTAFFNERRQFGLAEDIMRPPQHYWRNRFQYRHQITPQLRAYASMETFHRLDRRPEPQLRRIAYIGGLSQDLNKRSTLFIEYIHQPDHSRYARRLHTVNLGFDHDISPRKKKKKKKGVKAIEYDEGPSDRR